MQRYLKALQLLHLHYVCGIVCLQHWAIVSRSIVGLYGSDNFEAAICDQVIDTVKGNLDLLFIKYRAKTEEEKVRIYFLISCSCFYI